MRRPEPSVPGKTAPKMFRLLDTPLGWTFSILEALRPRGPTYCAAHAGHFHSTGFGGAFTGVAPTPSERIACGRPAGGADRRPNRSHTPSPPAFRWSSTHCVSGRGASRRSSTRSGLLRRGGRRSCDAVCHCCDTIARLASPTSRTYRCGPDLTRRGRARGAG